MLSLGRSGTYFRLGHEGWVGSEYEPRGPTEDGLIWLKTALSQILQVNSMLSMGREVAAPDIAERADDFEYHCRKAEAPVEG